MITRRDTLLMIMKNFKDEAPSKTSERICALGPETVRDGLIISISKHINHPGSPLSVSEAQLLIDELEQGIYNQEICGWLGLM